MTPGTGKSRLLLVPSISELEWRPIRPLLEEWAETASYNIVDAEASGAPPRLDLDAAIRRGINQLDSRGWTDALIAGDQFGAGLAVLIAERWSGRVNGLALGHACLNYRREGPRPAISTIVADFQVQLAELGPAAGKQMLAQGMEMTYGAEIGAAIMERLPENFARDFSRFLLAHGDIDLEPYLRKVDAPLLLAEHVDCPMWTQHGFEQIAEAFPQAARIALRDNPGSSPDFAAAIRRLADA
jgi:hypothetical protein